MDSKIIAIIFSVTKKDWSKRRLKFLNSYRMKLFIHWNVLIQWYFLLKYKKNKFVFYISIAMCFIVFFIFDWKSKCVLLT